MKAPRYEQGDYTCIVCEKPCLVVPLRNEFDYSGNRGSGTHYPQGWGDPVSDCCEADIEGARLSHEYE